MCESMWLGILLVILLASLVIGAVVAVLVLVIMVILVVACCIPRYLKQQSPNLVDLNIYCTTEEL